MMWEKSRLAVSMIFFSNGFMLANYVARLPDIQAKYHLDYQQIGFLLLASAIGSLMAMPFTGSLIATFSSKKVTLSAMGLVCTLVAIFSLIPTFALVLPIFFLIGVGSGMADVAMNAQAVTIERTHNQPIMSSFHGIWSVGLFTGAGMGTLFIALTDQLILHLLSVALLGISILFWSSFHLVDDQPPSLSHKNRLFNLPSKPMILIGAIAFCSMLGEGAMTDWSTNYMKDIMQLSDQLTPIGLMSFSLSMVIARMFGDRLRVRFGDPGLVKIGSILSLFGCTIIAFTSYFVLAIIGFSLCGLGLATLVPIAYSRAGNTDGIEPALGISMVTTIGYSGFIIGPPLLGLIADKNDLQSAFGFVLLLFVIMLLLCSRLR